LLVALAWVAIKDRRVRPTLRTLARASFAVLLFNWVFHGFWGGEQFLYSQHWHISLLVLLGASVSAIEERKWNSVIPLTIAVVGVAISNWIVLSKTLQALLGD
jgi:CHASE2 domain-containing sensor protein